ncbi:MAG TPA: CocE/NonD family hydrolase [Kribbella sp.]|uniref:CocE/NonD family hydrolase n=1 Tax=Kribbella sp. TaxID=1871183 RepID=UPI002D77FA26|nr:CocE/NonD family hydrolase [Kribbella sp.]HET6298469.1 CocE/NonD family hydrolase [Kribbella sp.]
MTTSAPGLDVQYKSGIPPAASGHPAPNRRSVVENGLRIDYDVPVPMRDGVEILIDIFRPDTGGRVPVIVAWSPYGKHAPVGYDFLEGSGVEPGTVSEYCALEAPDPAMFCPEGFAVVNVDPRGTWAVQGKHDMWRTSEGQDEHDLIEWLAEQDWCTSKVGLGGVSYLAISQWFAAATRPPHLAAINPWEGVSDVYREHVFHGGIPETKFVELVQWFAGNSSTEVEDLARMRDEHPMWNSYWATHRADLAAIDVPAYVVASWSDHGLHTRGSIEGFEQISSDHKYLEIHGRKKWAYYYLPESVARQKAFFARYLKDEANEVDSWPKVRYELRESYYKGEEQQATAWPIPGTQYRILHLDAQAGVLSESGAESGTTMYDAKTGHAYFDYTFEERSEVVGNASLTLWAEARGSNDMDVFVGLEKLDAAGNRVDFPYFSTREDGPVALGWLRASHRELDAQRSTPQQPWHQHTSEQPLDAGEVVELNVEIWPSGTVFEKGETLRLVVQGHDLRLYDHPASLHHGATRNAGTHILHTGTDCDSTLLIPVLT